MNNKKSIVKKVANNSLEFLIDPTVYPPERHIYFRPEEILDNSFYENARKDSEKTYGDQRQNSDFYPNRPIREASLMERKTLIASLDVLSQNFKEGDPIAKDLRTMAYAISKMSEEELKNRLTPDVEAKVEEKKADDQEVVAKGKDPKVPDPADLMEEDSDKKAVNDYWNKEATDAIRRSLVAEVKESCGDQDKMKKEEEEKEAAVPEVKESCDDKKKEEKGAVPPEEKKAEVEEKKEAATPDEKEEKAEEKKEDLVPEKKEVEAKDKKAEDVQPSKDEKEATEVDTSLLNASTVFDGIEMQAGLVTTEDIGDLSETEKSRLDLLFK